MSLAESKIGITKIAVVVIITILFVLGGVYYTLWSLGFVIPPNWNEMLPFRLEFLMMFIGVAILSGVVAVYGSNKSWGGKGPGILGGINKWIWSFIGGIAIFGLAMFLFSDAIYGVLLSEGGYPSLYEISLLGIVFGVAMGFVLIYVEKRRAKAYWRGF